MAVFSSSPETFFVEEVPAYRPSGTGSHTYLWIEKRGLTTPEAIRRLGRALGVRDRDVGYAGLKDRHATTRQWLSVPDVDPAVALATAVDGLKVMEAARHGNKLRLGHLRGNRFEVVLVEVAPGEAAALEAALRALAATGIPNRFGEQRFGATGDNVAMGLALLRGQRREGDARRRQFLLSAVQSAVFNRALELRAQSGGLLRLRGGDVLRKAASGGLFVSLEPAVDAPRVASGEVVPTGPLPGNREIEPPEGSEARILEDEALAAVGVTRAELASAGRDLPGARRPVIVPLALEEPAVVEVPVAPDGDTASGADAGAGVTPDARLRLRFALPAGSYATVLLEALAAPTLAEGKPVLTFVSSRAP